MERVVAGEPVTLTLEVESNDALHDADALPTLQVLREDGTELAPTGTHSVHDSVGLYHYDLAPAWVADVDRITGLWSYAVSAKPFVVKHEIDVAGGRYFDIDDLRALPDVDDEGAYPDARVERARRWIEAIVDRHCHTSFVRRYHRQVFDGDRLNAAGTLLLREQWIRDVLSVKVDGTFFTTDQLAQLAVFDEGRIERYRTGYGVFDNTVYQGWAYGDGFGATPWPRGRRNIDVRYAAGWSDEPPDDLAEVAVSAARHHLLDVDGESGIPTRATSITNEYGNVNLSTANEDRPTGIPNVDAVLNGWRETVRIPGIA